MSPDPLTEIVQVYYAAMQAVNAWRALPQPVPALDPAMRHLQDLLQQVAERAQALRAAHRTAAGGPDAP
jgi:prefoldin subunit 5